MPAESLPGLAWPQALSCCSREGPTSGCGTRSPRTPHWLYWPASATWESSLIQVQRHCQALLQLSGHRMSGNALLGRLLFGGQSTSTHISFHHISCLPCCRASGVITSRRARCSEGLSSRQLLAAMRHINISQRDRN